MNLRNCTLLLSIAALSPSAVAGPPLICHPIEIHGAKSLPWRASAQGWDGAERSYDVSANLIPDTLTLLSPQTPVPVRMETMRRASIYAARVPGLAAKLADILESRTIQPAATSLDWFDAGYWIESVRQASFIYRYDMLSPAEKGSWHIRTGLEGRDGYPMLKKAMALGAVPGMERALSLVEEYRNADRRKSGS